MSRILNSSEIYYSVYRKEVLVVIYASKYKDGIYWLEFSICDKWWAVKMVMLLQMTKIYHQNSSDENNNLQKTMTRLYVENKRTILILLLLPNQKKIESSCINTDFSTLQGNHSIHLSCGYELRTLRNDFIIERT